MRNILISIRYTSTVVIIALILTIHGICLGSDNTTQYAKWETTGKMAAEKALALIKNAASKPKKRNLIVLTNAGYSEAGGELTQGALDGLAAVTGVSRGKNTLVEIHSAPWAPLWFAFYDKGSGYCAYLEANAPEKDSQKMPSAGMFSISSVERIDADYLYGHADEYKSKFKNKIFNGNEFRILTIANAIAQGAPVYVVRSVEFHDHYCPGVNSGIVMSNYIKKNFPPDDEGYFIQSVTPWCKEDALQVMLNVTAGKKSYIIYHPSDADLAARKPEFKDVSTIVYRHDKKSNTWQGIALKFVWAGTKFTSTGNQLIDKMRNALWYLDYLDRSEDFVKVVKSFQLPEGVTPKDWARPGIDPLEKIASLTKSK
ncbi:MAG: FmdE family protein [Desulfobacteraceae bacterium]|jgi:formylmethanofuran dehydrogenase subunit E-like metal-binding protein